MLARLPLDEPAAPHLRPPQDPCSASRIKARGTKPYGLQVRPGPAVHESLLAASLARGTGMDQDAHPEAVDRRSPVGSRPTIAMLAAPHWHWIDPTYWRPSWRLPCRGGWLAR